MPQTKYVIRTTYNDVPNFWYTGKDLYHVVPVLKNATRYTVQELIDMDLKNHFAYDRMIIEEAED